MIKHIYKKALLLSVYSLLFTANHSFSEQPIEWPTSEGGNAHFYEVVYAPDNITWTAASNAAVNAGGYLATITSSNENEFVFALLDDPQYWHTNIMNGVNGPWLGAHKPNDEFVWITGEPFVYTNWSKHSPNGYWQGVKEDKLSYLYNGEKVPTWNDQRNDPALWDDLTDPPVDVRIKSYVIEYDSITLDSDIEIFTSIELVFPTSINASYQIQTSSNMTNWVESGVPFLGDGTTNNLHFSTRNNEQQFYRIKETMPPAIP
jgi:hypothetical protein